MSFLSMVEAKLPPGFRFHPRDDELVCDYLIPRIGNNYKRDGWIEGFFGCNNDAALVDVDLNKCEPWDLPDAACVAGKEWYFFSIRDRKYATGQRTNRATQTGYWKATGKDRQVMRRGGQVGMRKTLVFYRGRAPKGKKTEWVMHEYRVETTHHHSPNPNPNPTSKEDWVLCRVFSKQRGHSGSNSTKPEMDTSTTYTSPSLPPLTDCHVTPSAQQVQLNSAEGFAFAFGTTSTTTEQVPCFSSFNTSHSSSGYLPNHQLGPLLYPPMERNLTQLGSCFNQVKCDSNVLKVFLSHLNQTNLATGSCGTHLSEMGLASSWGPFS